jgi:hypothetical protein
VRVTPSSCSNRNFNSPEPSRAVNTARSVGDAAVRRDSVVRSSSSSPVRSAMCCRLRSRTLHACQCFSPYLPQFGVDVSTSTPGLSARKPEVDLVHDLNMPLRLVGQPAYKAQSPQARAPRPAAAGQAMALSCLRSCARPRRQRCDPHRARRCSRALRLRAYRLYAVMNTLTGSEIAAQTRCASSSATLCVADVSST